MPWVLEITAGLMTCKQCIVAFRLVDRYRELWSLPHEWNIF